jgi:sugar phosphate isomerase/epimerase
MNTESRRHLLSRSGQLALGASLLPATVRAIEKDRFTIGLSQYSLRAMFADKSLAPLDFATFAADNFGIHAIDLWEGGLPKDKLEDAAYMAKLRASANKAKSDLFLLMAGTFDATPDKHEASVKSFLPSLDRAQQLGARYLRVFLRAPGTDAEVSANDSAEALKRLADEAAKRKVTIVIEPAGSPLSVNGAFLAKVMEKMKHPHCKLMPDFGKQKNNIYDGTEAMMPHTVSVSAKMHSFDEHGKQPDFDYMRLMKIIADAGFKGIIAIEWEGSRLKPIEGVKASQKLLAEAIAALG